MFIVGIVDRVVVGSVVMSSFDCCYWDNVCVLCCFKLLLFALSFLL